MQCEKKIPKTLEEKLHIGCYTTSYKTVFILVFFSKTWELWNNTLLVLVLIVFGIKLSQQSNILICLKPIPCSSAMIPENPYNYICKQFNKNIIFYVIHQPLLSLLCKFNQRYVATSKSLMLKIESYAICSPFQPLI